MGRQVTKRWRIKRQLSFEERLINVAREARAAAAELPPGKQRDQLIRKASQHETAANIDEWLSSAGLTPPEDVAGHTRKVRHPSQ
jgi:hypothetical protein